MKMLPYASTLALAGMLALGHTDGGPRPAPPRIELLSRVTQYCVPPGRRSQCVPVVLSDGMADRQRLTRNSGSRKPCRPFQSRRRSSWNERDGVPRVPLPTLRVRKRPAHPRPAASSRPGEKLLASLRGFLRPWSRPVALAVPGLFLRRAGAVSTWKRRTISWHWPFLDIFDHDHRSTAAPAKIANPA